MRLEFIVGMLLFTLVLIYGMSFAFATHTMQCQPDKPNTTSSYENGFNDGLEMAEEKRLNKQTTLFQRGATNYTVDGYDIYLHNITLNQTWTGYTTRTQDLHIQNNRPIKDIYQTCVHEKLHNTHPNKTHEWINQHETSLDQTCLELLYLINGDK